MLQLTFNPELTLIGFRTTRPRSPKATPGKNSATVVVVRVFSSFLKLSLSASPPDLKVEVDISQLITWNTNLDASDVMRILGFEILHQLRDWNLPERKKVIESHPGWGPRLLKDLQFRFADLRSYTFSLKKPELYWNPDKEKSKGKFSITTNQSINGRDIASSSINAVLQKQTSPWTVFLL